MKFSLAVLALVPFVAAHFTLDYPATRGFDEDLEPRFCGGFPNPSSERAPFPLSGPGSILIDSHHPSAQVAIIAAVGYTNVTSFADFNKTASGQATTGMLMPFGTIQGQGEASYSKKMPKGGQKKECGASTSTFLPSVLPTSPTEPLPPSIEYNGGDGLLLQCADVTLVNNYVAPSNLTCRNATSASTSTTNASTTTTAATTASGTNNTPAATTTGAKSAAGKHVVGGLVGSLSIVALALLV